ncbi:MAG: hypothetical protein QOJ27_2721 [Sphingomonadales bacterium]|nr:hypothetical protein [Sphingomonadales bacterium]
MIVLRNGVVIGSAPVTIDAQIDRTSAFVMQNGDAAGRSWLGVPLPGQSAAPAAAELRGRIHVEDRFRQHHGARHPGLAARRERRAERDRGRGLIGRRRAIA